MRELRCNDPLPFLIVALLAMAGSAHAHSQWANGQPIPAWIKSACCGVADAHMVDDRVHQVEGGWTVDGFNPSGDPKQCGAVDWACASVIPDRKVLPSEDGHFWAFYADHGNGTTGAMYCFFAPESF